MNDALPASSNRTPLAILCADVHGYARLMAKDQELTQERVNRSICLIRCLMSEYGGRIANIAGDGLVALFASTAQALQFASAIQRELWEETARDPEAEPIAFRIGINHGEVFLGEGNVQGHSINVAARIQALARPGGICVTDAVRQVARDSVGGTVRPLGHKYLKNIDEPIEVFAIDVNGGEVARLLPLGASLRPPCPVVAVEPFETLSGCQDDTYLALAMSESLVQALSKFKWLTVKEDRASGLVTPVLASMPTGSLDEGGYVVAGRLLRMRGSLRLFTKLREHPGGRIIWSTTSDLKVGQKFKRVDELAAILAARLDRQVLMAEVADACQEPLEGLDAQGYMMRAIPLMFQMSKGSLREAEQLLRVADEGQPRSSRSRALRGFAALIRIGQQWAADPRAAEEEIDWLTRSAIECSPSDPIALSLRGHVESFIFHRFDAGLDCFERALQSNSFEPLCWAFSAITLSYIGRTDEGLRRLKRYRELCPVDSHPFYFDTAFSLSYALAGDYAKAVEIGRRAVADNPNYFAAYRPLITSLGRLGEVDEARQLLDKLLANEPQFSIGWFRSKYPPLPSARFEQYLEGFREVGVPDD